jgi:hypothetical protein
MKLPLRPRNQAILKCCHTIFFAESITLKDEDQEKMRKGKCDGLCAEKCSIKHANAACRVDSVLVLELAAQCRVTMPKMSSVAIQQGKLFGRARRSRHS